MGSIRHFDSELPEYAAMSSKIRRSFKNKMRPRIWQEKIVSFDPFDHDTFFGETRDECEWNCSVWRVLFDGAHKGWYWHWSDHKRSGSRCITVAEKLATTGDGDHPYLGTGCFPDAILDMLDRASRQKETANART